MDDTGKLLAQSVDHQLNARILVPSGAVDRPNGNLFRIFGGLEQRDQAALRHLIIDEEVTRALLPSSARSASVRCMPFKSSFRLVSSLSGVRFLEQNVSVVYLFAP